MERQANPLRILVRIRLSRGRPKGRRERDVRRLMELARAMWMSFSRRYGLKWLEGEIVETR